MCFAPSEDVLPTKDLQLNLLPMVCKRWFPNSGSSLVRRANSRTQLSGEKKEPKPKLLDPDIFGWGGGLPREWVGAKKFGMCLGTQGKQTIGRDIPRFCRDIPELPEKFEKIEVYVQILPPKLNLNLPLFN